MRRIITFILLLVALSATAQRNVVQNRPYTDLRRLHFGVFFGTHLQDIELQNVGPQLITNDDGSTVEQVITCDQDRWDLGFNVGVLAELRLNSNLALRFAPGLYFGTRRLTFHNLTESQADGSPVTERQTMKSVYLSAATNLIFAAKRLNNTRPYVMAGLNPMLNMSGKDSDILRLKRGDVYLEAGLGCDFYLPMFKFRPELKFCYGLINTLDADHPSRLKDKNLLPYAQSVGKAHTKMIVLTLYFE